MNKIKIIFLFVLVLLPLKLNATQILDLKWGESPHNINYFTTPDGVYGISDFYVDGHQIGLLNNFNHSIDIFENGIYKYSIENIPEETIILENNSKKIYFFTRDGIAYQIQNGSFIKLEKIKGANNLSAILFFNNVLYPINRYEKYVHNNLLMDAIIENPHLSQIRVYDENNIATYSFTTSDNIAAITPVGLIDDLLVIAVEYDMGLKREIKTVNLKGDIISEISLPNRFLLNDVRDIKIYQNKIYILASDKDGIKIYEYDGYTNGNITISSWTKKLYEYNDNVNYEQRLLALTSVKRSEALALAKQYNDHIWTAKSCNVGTTTCTDWCDKQKTIKPPSWVVVGTNNRFPYSWGGFSTISQFDQGLTDCKKAGDIQTKYADGTSACGSSCSVGVDCSGFVSRLWKQTTKYGTSTIMQIATKINKSDLKPADALNDTGSHIRLFVGFRSDGKWDMVESYAGSGYWGVGYTVRTPAENDGYDAIRYNAIVDDSVPTNKPPVISHTPVTSSDSGKDILISAKITDDGGKIASATLRFKNESEANFTALTMVDKGSGNFEATISASSIKSSKLYYYIAAWDGESPVQTGVNRSILPEKAEDSANPQYFVITINQPNTPPVIVHTPITSAYSGQDIIISAKITDDSGKIQAANIKYKNEGDSIMKTINMVDKGGSIYEAKISAAFITAKKIYYYIAAWDGESPVQTGRNRTILPEKAEDLFPIYFTINIIGSTSDAGVDSISYPDTSYPDSNIEDISTDIIDTEVKDVLVNDTPISEDTNVTLEDKTSFDTSNVEDIMYYEDISRRTTDLKKLGEESEEGGCGCTLIE